MKRQNKKFTLKEKKRFSRLLKKDLRYKTNQEIKFLIKEHEEEQTKLFEIGMEQ